MWTFVRLAIRNVRRNHFRTLLTLGAIGFGVLMTVFLGGMSQGFTNMMMDDSIRGKVGALQIHKKGYYDVKESSPLDFDIEQGGALEQKIRSVPGIKDVAPRLVFQALINGPGATSMLVTTAVDPQHEYEVLSLASDDVVGKRISADAPTGGLIGLDLADSLGFVEHRQKMTKDGPVEELAVKPGSTAIISAARKSGQQNALDVDVNGIINSGNAFESKRVAFVPLAWAQDLLDMKGRVNEYLISVRNEEEIPAVKKQLEAALGDGYEVFDWRQARPQIGDVIDMQTTVLKFVCVVFLIIAVIGVVNTMLMSVLERTREIGTMLAVGVKRVQIAWLFLLEALTLAIIGGFGGAAMGAGIVGLIKRAHGFTITQPGSTAIRHIVPTTPPALIEVAVIAAMLGSLGAAVYPAWRASRLRPVEALRAI